MTAICDMLSAMKQCLGCGQRKELSEFYWSSSDRMRAGGRYVSRCKECMRPGLRELARKRGLDPVIREQRNAYARSDAGKVIKRRYARSPKGRAMAAKHKAQSKALRKDLGSWTAEDINKRYAYQAGRCLGCYQQFTESFRYTLDHNLPVTRGGRNTYDNLLLLCGPCNTSKHAQTFAEWMTKRYG